MAKCDSGVRSCDLCPEMTGAMYTLHTPEAPLYSVKAGAGVLEASEGLMVAWDESGGHCFRYVEVRGQWDISITERIMGPGLRWLCDECWLQHFKHKS